ncbi:MAG: AlpA family phage regulatory protein [Syntrophales bacterium]|jgi:prophage regulatory protein|nr:AlpA family phage regulatory protein [Syntrophales bacterium]MCK9527213.1 AlpA family phage regulatory protein [Syntrophales bacterium]MDX9921317.1 AlpA family phage regulatory protein [Syntrophales bacterium]
MQKQRIIRKPELLAIIGLSDATIWRLEKAGRFPKRVKLGGNSVGWFNHEISSWLERKATERYDRGRRDAHQRHY